METKSIGAALDQDESIPRAQGVDTRSLRELKALEVAERLAAERRARGQWIKGSFFSDPAWELLLDLFCELERHGQCSLRRILVGSFLQARTAERWVVLLEDEGLVELYPSERSSSCQLRLTAKGYGSMCCYLAQVAASWGYRLAP